MKISNPGKSVRKRAIDVHCNVHLDHTIAIDFVVLPRKRTIEEVLAGFDLDVSRVWFKGETAFATAPPGDCPATN